MLLKDFFKFNSLQEALAYFDSKPEILYISRFEWNNYSKYICRLLYYTVVPFVFYDDAANIDYSHYERKLNLLYSHKSCGLCRDNPQVRNTQMLGTFALNNFYDLTDTVDYMFIGIAGGDDKGKLRKRDYFKLYELGPTTDILKTALIECNLLHRSYVTNLVKCMIINNDRAPEQVTSECYKAVLKKEIELINPKKIFLWSGECVEFFNSNNLTYHGRLYHPSYYIYKGNRRGFTEELKAKTCCI